MPKRRLKSRKAPARTAPSRKAGRSNHRQRDLKALMEVARTGDQALIGALVGPHLALRSRIEADSLLLPKEAWSELMIVPFVDLALTELGADWPEGPDLWSVTDWPSQIRWAVDRYVEIFRLLRAGATTAAALATRTFLERWSMNLANHFSLERTPEESESEYITRVWNTYEDNRRDHDVGQYWAELSELLHGRPLTKHQPYGRPLLLARLSLPERYWMHAKLSVIAKVIFRQVRGTVTTLAAERHLEPFHPTVGSGYLVLEDSPPELPFMSDATRPLDYLAAFSPASTETLKLGHRYRPALRDLFADYLHNGQPVHLAAVWAFLERRARTISLARKSFAFERKMFGPEFAPASLSIRIGKFVSTSEMALYVASDSVPAQRRDALCAAAAGLDAAWRLWLEDTDLAMGAVRVLLEQTARARTWRLRPIKADKLDSRPHASAPSRWVEEAGWRRLGSYLRALGEFAHMNPAMRRSSARSLLDALQGGADGASEQTARREALQLASELLALELAESLEASYPTLAKAYLEDALGVSHLDLVRHCNSVFDHAQNLKSTFDWGDPDWRSAPHSPGPNDPSQNTEMPSPVGDG